MRKIAVIIFAVLLAFAILFISILRSASVRYEFTGDVGSGDTSLHDEELDYYLAYPGNILPDNPLWTLKVIRDKVWYYSTTDGGRKAELYLLFADKRLSASKALFEKGEYEIGFSTLVKAQQYFEKAKTKEQENRENGQDTYEFLDRLARASLRHAFVIDEIKNIAPEDAIPQIIVLEKKPRMIFFDVSGVLSSIGRPSPINPFGWD